MARVEVPITVINSSTGLPVAGAAAAITHRATGDPVTWYTTEGGSTSSTSSVITDSAGRIVAWVAPGKYNITVSGTGLTTYTEAWDAVPGSSLIFRTSHAYIVSGDIGLPSGDSNFIPPFFVSLASGQTASLIGVKHRLNAGATVTYKVQRNGTDIGGSWTGLTAESTADEAVSPGSISLADGDKLAIVVTGSGGTSKNLSVTLFIEHYL